MKENKISSLIAHLFQGVFLLITAVLCVGPFVWVIFSSFKSNKEILNSAFALPNAWNFDGYRRALEMSPIFLFFGNSVFISITNTIISVLVVAMAAYAIARFNFRGKTLFTLSLSSSLLVPISALLMPIYLIMSRIGLLDSKASLILVYAALGLPTSLFILRGTFLAIPREIEEAAAIDGSGQLRTFFQIVMPMAKSGLATAATLHFLTSWNEFMFALVLTKSERVRTLPLGYYYNKDLFAQAGIEAPPETWEEFEADCDKLLAAGITPISMDTADSGWCTSLLMGAMIGQTDTGEKFMNTNQPDSFVNDDVIQAAARIQKMFQNYTTTDAIGGEYGAAANNFFNEKTAIIANGPWMVSKFYDTSIVSDDFADKIAAAAYPGNVMYNSGQVGWSIASKTPEKIEASLAFVKFMTSEESQKMDLEMCSVVPDRSIEGADVYPLVNDTIALADKASHSINDYQSLWQASVVDEVSVQYPLLADGSISPEEFAEALTSAIS